MFYSCPVAYAFFYYYKLKEKEVMVMYGYNPYPYQQRLSMLDQPRYEIIHVNGENGARALQMAPNSNALLLDDTADLIWLAQTDGAGYKTVTPFSIAPYQPTPPVSIDKLEERIARLEAMLNEQNPEPAESKRKSAAE